MNSDTLIKESLELDNILDTSLSVDMGETYVKTSAGIIFTSTVFPVEKYSTPKLDQTQVTWGDKVYTVGGRYGLQNVQVTEYSSDNYKLCLLTAIALSFKCQLNIKVRLCLGLPPAYFYDHNIKLKDEIIKLPTQKIIIDIEGKSSTYDIEIINVQVFEQGATLSDKYKSKLEYPMMLIDFGGRTLNVSVWEYQRSCKSKRREEVLFKTNMESFNQLDFHSIILKFVNKFNFVEGSTGTYDEQAVIDVLSGKEPFSSDAAILQEIKDEVLRPYLLHVKNAFYMLDTCWCDNMKIIGGPAKLLIYYIKQLYPESAPALIEQMDPQYANAMLFSQKHKEILTTDYYKNILEIASTSTIE